MKEKEIVTEKQKVESEADFSELMKKIYDKFAMQWSTTNASFNYLNF